MKKIKKLIKILSEHSNKNEVDSQTFTTKERNMFLKET